MLIAAQKHKERMKDLWSCLIWILFPSACRISSSSKRAPSLCPPIPAAPHCSGQILPANTPWDPRFGWGSVERRCTGKWCWGLGPAAAVPGPAPGKWGAYKGRGLGSVIRCLLLAKLSQNLAVALTVALYLETSSKKWLRAHPCCQTASLRSGCSLPGCPCWKQPASSLHEAALRGLLPQMPSHHHAASRL